MKYVKTFEEFVNDKYSHSLKVNEALDPKQWKEKQKEIIKEIKDFGKQIGPHLKKAKTDEDWNQLFKILKYFDSDMDADLLDHEEDSDEYSESEINSENLDVFKDVLKAGLKEAMDDIKTTDAEEWDEMDQEDWIDEDLEYGNYIQAKARAKQMKFIK